MRDGCDHLSVHIRAIRRAYSEQTQSRTIAGRCQNCAGEVERVMTRAEIVTGKFQTEWRIVL